MRATSDPDVARIEADYLAGHINHWEYRQALTQLFRERERYPRPETPACRLVDERDDELDFGMGLDR